MPMSSFPSGYADGVSIRGMPLLNSYGGNVYWVSSTQGGASNGNRGTFDRPFSTIDYAVGRCAADKGDVIMVKPGHLETVTAAGGIALDVAGISVIGLGTGSKRPQVNFTTAVGASMTVTAANVTVQNILFTGGIDALTGPITLGAADCALINIETRDVTGQATDFIVTDDACDRLMIRGWKHLGAAAAGADTAISLVGGDDWLIDDFDIYGNFAVAAIENVTTASARVRIGGGAGHNYIWTENAADVAITLVATTTGNVGPNINIMLQDNAANITEAVVGAAAQFFLPINIANLAGEVAMLFNGTASTDA